MMQLLKRCVAQFLELEKLLELDGRHLYHKVAAGIHDLCFQTLEAEQRGYEKAPIVAIIQPAREIQGRSPFIKRLQSWPRGYPGDFETIEYLCEQKNRATPNTIEFHCETYALSCSVAQQHRNKVRHQAALMLHTLRKQTSKPPKILSMACGGCRDIRSIAPSLGDSKGGFVLNDIDKDALDLAKSQLHGLKSAIHLVHGNVIHKLDPIEKMGPFDLIVIGGLFDYLPDKYVRFILKHARKRLLKPSGQIFFTNIMVGNPYRVWIEYFADWRLIERSENDVRLLMADAGFDAGEVRIDTDETGLALLVSAGKNADSKKVYRENGNELACSSAG